MIKAIKSIAKNTLYDHFLSAKRKSTNKYELFSTLDGVSLADLTHSELKAIQQTWGGIMGKDALTTEYWRLYKTFGSFSQNFVPDDAYMPIIIRTLNPLHQSKTFENKSLYPCRLRGVNQPEVLLNSIRGVWYDGGGHVVTQGEGLELLNCVDEFIVKKSKGSCSGIGVRKLRKPYDGLAGILEAFGDDFVCQKIVKQSEKTKMFHPASLNTFRVNSLYINGVVSVDTIMFKHGNNNSFVDNGHAGGLFVGVRPDGSFMETAYDANYHQYKQTPNGIPYGETKIAEDKNLVEAVKQWHVQYYPDMGFIGWDVALDGNNEPVFIESNLGYPGILIVQLSANTPIFGDRTHEVLEYVKHHKEEISMYEFIGSSL